MKKNLRDKIREFVQSEEDRVGIKSPLNRVYTSPRFIPVKEIFS